MAVSVEAHCHIRLYQPARRGRPPVPGERRRRTGLTRSGPSESQLGDDAEARCVPEHGVMGDECYGLKKGCTPVTTKGCRLGGTPSKVSLVAGAGFEPATFGL